MNENNFLGLFAWVRIKTHFPLKCQIAYFTQITIQRAHRGINILYCGKKGRVICKELSSC